MKSLSLIITPSNQGVNYTPSFYCIWSDFQMIHLNSFSWVLCVARFRAGLLPCASWGHCIWVTVPVRVMGRSSSCWGPHVTVAVVLGSSRAGPRLLKCWQLQTKIWKAKHGEWEGERERERERKTVAYRGERDKDRGMTEQLGKVLETFKSKRKRATITTFIKLLSQTSIKISKMFSVIMYLFLHKNIYIFILSTCIRITQRQHEW